MRRGVYAKMQTSVSSNTATRKETSWIVRPNCSSSIGLTHLVKTTLYNEKWSILPNKPEHHLINSKDYPT